MVSEPTSKLVHSGPALNDTEKSRTSSAPASELVPRRIAVITSAALVPSISSELEPVPPS